ncbi:MAG: 2-C-methyl-D-erythritol 4-phosphate cytidylyltransferase [Eubacteriales bacterium]|nr:2-C-methyl-D-erythritol 4-phosphate cytidylyltransferase [Eubacteriales bacterium]
MQQEIYVLIAAAGTGSRMGMETNKQFLEISGIPAVIRSIRSFDSMSQISGIRVIAAQSDLSTINQLISSYQFKHNIDITTGGQTRQHSVLNGLRDLAQFNKPSQAAVILVHDGARCLVTQDVIKHCIDGITQNNCACAAATPVKDTIKQVALDADPTNPLVEKTLDRNRLWALQTPQGGFFQDLLTAYETVTEQGKLVTDDLAVMEAAGHKTMLTTGDYRNIKITTPEDIIVAEAYLSSEAN